MCIFVGWYDKEIKWREQIVATTRDELDCRLPLLFLSEII
jgi:hypothetical protein